MTAFQRQFTQTAAGGSVLMDVANEASWAHWAHLIKLTPDRWTVINSASTGFRRNLQMYVHWSRDGTLTGTPIFSSSILPHVEPLIQLTRGIWTPLHLGGFLWTDNNGVGGNPSNYTFHKRAFHVYTFHQSSRVTTILRCEGDFNEPPYSYLRDKLLLLRAVGITA